MVTPELKDKKYLMIFPNMQQIPLTVTHNFYLNFPFLLKDKQRKKNRLRERQMEHRHNGKIGIYLLSDGTLKISL